MEMGRVSKKVKWVRKSGVIKAETAKFAAAKKESN
jgi:hypothetical protein